MEKAYDFKDLAERMESVGLEMGEEGAKEAIDVLADWYIESATLSKNPFDNVGIAFMGELKGKLKELAEGINPEDNGPEAA